MCVRPVRFFFYYSDNNYLTKERTYPVPLHLILKKCVHSKIKVSRVYGGILPPPRPRLGGPKKLSTRAAPEMRAAESLFLVVIGVLGAAHLAPGIRRSVRKSIFRYVV